MAATASASSRISDDIVCEILTHCGNLSWSFRELALLCRINQAMWLQPSRRNLYRNIRLDYRHEVAKLARSLDYNPTNTALVHSLCLNGDGAHASGIIELLSSFHALRSISFFDFELHSQQEQAALCRAIPLTNLDHVSFEVIPTAFFTQALRHCSKQIRSLYVYRVGLGTSEGWLDETRWDFPRLEHIELWYVGSVSAELFSALVIKHSHRLRTLKICFERSYPLCHDSEFWTKCSLGKLVTLELRHFHKNVLLKILRSCHKLQKLNLSAPQPSQVAVSANNIASLSVDTESSLVSSIPPSVQQLEILGIPDVALLGEFRAGHNLAGLACWPKLLRLPKISVVSWLLAPAEEQELRRAVLRLADECHLRYTEEEAEKCFHSM